MGNKLKLSILSDRKHAEDIISAVEISEKRNRNTSIIEEPDNSPEESSIRQQLHGMEQTAKDELVVILRRQAARRGEEVREQ